MLKLSEAIRLGAMLRPQARGGYFVKGGSCAIGAALEAIGMNSKCLDAGPALSRWPLARNVVPCPQCLDSGTAWSMAAHLNDHHQWTREQIADWVATVEAQDELQHAEPVAVASDTEVAFTL